MIFLVATLLGVKVPYSVALQLFTHFGGWNFRFSHEFGVEKCGHDEIETVYPVTLSDPDDPRHFVTEELARHSPHRNRRYKKRVRQWLRKIDHELAALDPDSFYSRRELDSALDNARN